MRRFLFKAGPPQLRGRKGGPIGKAHHQAWVRRCLIAIPLVLLILSQVLQGPQYSSKNSLLLGGKDDSSDDGNKISSVSSYLTAGLRGAAQ